MIFIILTLWSLFTYFFLRLHFLIWNWNFFSHQSLGEIAWAFLQGLRFDLSAISILNLLPGLLFFGATFLPKKWFLRLVYGAIMPLTLVLHAVFLIFNLNDSEFIHFLGRRFTFDSIYLIKEMQGKTGDLIASYWELNLINGCFLIFVFMILIYTLRKWIHGVSQKMELKKDLDNQNKVYAKNNEKIEDQNVNESLNGIQKQPQNDFKNEIQNEMQKEFDHDSENKNEVNKIILNNFRKSSKKLQGSIIKESFSIILFLGLSLVAARGGLQNKPINFAHAQIFQQPLMNSLAMNSSFSLIQTIKRKGLERSDFMDSHVMLERLRNLSEGQDFESIYPNTKNTSSLNLRRPLNIVLIILESFSYEFFEAAGTGTTYTPFLNQLGQKALFFTQAYANARRSIEGIGAIVGGIPSLMSEPFISSQYLTNHFLGAGTLLAEKKYHTSFFHGAKNGSMYFDQFMKSAGIENYYGKNEYPRVGEDDDGTWGIWDEPFFQFAQEKMNSFPEPFFSAIFSLTSHHPYRIPKEYQGKFQEGHSEIQAAASYTDMALEKFFKSAEKEKWYSNTIFIITADHTFKAISSKYNNELGNYRIPLIIFSPQIALPSVDTRQVVQQIDILPTMLDLAGISQKESLLLSKSIFKNGPRWAINYSDGKYYFVKDNYWLSLLASDLKKLKGPQLEKNPSVDTHYESSQDKIKMYLTSDLEGLQNVNEFNRQKELVTDLMAMVQYFSQAMWDNKIYYPTQ